MTPAETLIEDLSALEPIKTWSLIVTLFGDLNGQPVTGKQLGAILGRVGIKTEAMRVALHRLRKEGWIVSTKIGREVTYSLSSHGLAETRAVYEDVYRQDVKFPDGWCVALTRQDCEPTGAMIRLDRALFLVPVSEATRSDQTRLRFEPEPVPMWFAGKIVAPQTITHVQRLHDLAGRMDFLTLPALPQATIRLLLLHHWRKIALRGSSWAHISLCPDGPLALCHQRVSGLLAELPKLSTDHLTM